LITKTIKITPICLHNYPQQEKPNRFYSLPVNYQNPITSIIIPNNGISINGYHYGSIHHTFSGSKLINSKIVNCVDQNEIKKETSLPSFQLNRTEQESTHKRTWQLRDIINTPESDYFLTNSSLQLNPQNIVYYPKRCKRIA